QKSLPQMNTAQGQEIDPIIIPRGEDEVIQYDVEYTFLKTLEKQIGSRLYILTSDYPPRNFVYGDGRPHFEKAHYYNVGLREQHMTAMAHGIYRIRPDAVVVVLCGDAFIYRHMDQINALAQAKTRVIFYSVQGGLSGAKNGSTHQSSGQTGSLLMIPGLTVEEPCSAVQFIRSSNNALAREGPTYIRMQKTPVPWSFMGVQVDGYEVVRQFKDANGTIVTSGMLAEEALKAVLHLYVDEGIGFNLIVLTDLTNASGFSQYIVGHKPLFTYYNGDSRVLQHIVANDICQNGVDQPWPIKSKGFTLGTTGSIGDLLKHFHLDWNSIFEECKEAVSAHVHC
ncbi:MAG: hypothetical protein WD898_02120, partial [Candidatus Paceibacterota bacterium]